MDHCRMKLIGQSANQKKVIQYDNEINLKRATDQFCNILLNLKFIVDAT